MRENPLPPLHRLLFLINCKGSFISSILRQYSTYHSHFSSRVVEHWLEREITQWVHHERSIRWPITPWANALTMELHLEHTRPLRRIIEQSTKADTLLAHHAGESWKEMFHLTMHSTHFIYGYMAKNHSDSKRENQLLPHGLLFSISSKRVFYMHCPTDKIPQPLLHQSWSWNEK